MEAVINKLGGEKGVSLFLSDKLVVVPASKSTKPAKANKPKLLVSDGSYSAVVLKDRHDPSNYYQTREGLYVYPDFRDRIVSAAKLSEAGKKFKKISRFKLAVDATGEQLRAERPNSVWKASDFCAWLSIKLASQPKGEEGELLNTGWANLFLVEGLNGEVFVVGVYGDSDYREWYVRTWPLSNAWVAGRQFASRN